MSQLLSGYYLKEQGLLNEKRNRDQKCKCINRNSDIQGANQGAAQKCKHSNRKSDRLGATQMTAGVYVQ